MAKCFSWDPWLELENLKEEMTRLVTQTTCPSPFVRKMGNVGQFRPVADVLETEDAFIVLIELPGLERENVFLEVHGREITVFGERKPPEDLPNGAFQILERAYGCFSRRFTFPSPIDAADVDASMQSGLLQVVISKRNTLRRNRQISVLVED